MHSRHPVQYTIRGVPPEVDLRLRDMARRLHRSLNRTLREIISKAAGRARTSSHRDLDAFFGSWTPDPAVDRALRDQRAVDPDLWR